MSFLIIEAALLCTYDNQDNFEFERVVELSQYLLSMSTRVDHRPWAMSVSAHQFIYYME